MITVPKEEFLQFIKDQPDEKELNFGGNTQNDKCGCPMMQYARKKKWAIKCVGYQTFIRNWCESPFAELENGFNFDDFYRPDATTFGELKKALNL